MTVTKGSVVVFLLLFSMCTADVVKEKSQTLGSIEAFRDILQSSAKKLNPKPKTNELEFVDNLFGSWQTAMDYMDWIIRVISIVSKIFHRAWQVSYCMGCALIILWTVKLSKCLARFVVHITSIF